MICHLFPSALAPPSQVTENITL